MPEAKHFDQAGQSSELPAMTHASALPERPLHYPVAVVGLALALSLVWFGFWIWLTARALRTIAS
jgi:hypothetical protein